MVIHFPIALLFVAFLSEVIGLLFKKTFFTTAAFYLLILGTFGTIAAYFSGGAAGEGMEEGTFGKAIGMHEEAAVISLLLAVVSSLVYSAIVVFKYEQKWAKFITVVLMATLIGAISRTAYLGGQLVYKHGAGVELALPDFNETDNIPN